MDLGLRRCDLQRIPQTVALPQAREGFVAAVNRRPFLAGTARREAAADCSEADLCNRPVLAAFSRNGSEANRNAVIALKGSSLH